MIGRTIGHYQVLEKLGEGGMGVVWKARDTQLDRLVALKVLPPEKLGSPEARARFEREARAISKLNHPHICTLHDVGHQEGMDYLVMELVEGKPVRGPLPLEEALRLAVQIADALDHAHRQGVVHRDLKPGNILVTKSGAKLLDFGLAKMGSAAGGDVTKTAGLTQEGAVLGTYHYMAPEQWEGKPADARADIFAFGVVLYEMLSGRRAFEGVEPLAPPALDRAVKRCLEKDPERRWQTAADLKEVLAWIAEPAAPAEPPRAGRWLPWGVAALLVAVAFIAGLWLRRPEPAREARVRKFAFTPELPLASPGVRRAAISPDGRRIAYVTGGVEGKLWIRDLEQEQPQAIAGTEGARAPFWSPDSQFVGFFAGFNLNKVSAQRGFPITLCQLPSVHFSAGSWSPDGQTIVFSSGGVPGLYQVPSRGGAREHVLSPGATPKGAANRGPQFLSAPGGARLILFEAGYGGDRDILAANLETREWRLVTAGVFPTWSPSGHLIYQEGPGKARLWALPFSIRTLKPAGEAFPIAEGATEPSVSSDGTLVYLSSSAGVRQQLVWRDREGKKLGVIGQAQDEILYPVLSPDGLRVAVTGTENNNQDVWVHEVARPVKNRLTFEPASDMHAKWLPGGKEIVFSSQRAGTFDIYAQAADGSGQARLLAATPAQELVSDCSPDGKYILYTVDDPKTNLDIRYLKRRPAGEAFDSLPFLHAQFNEQIPRLSPDGRLVAYVSDESGRNEIYVRPFPEGEGKWQVSTSGGTQPRWSRDGKELFYVEGATLMVVPVASEERFSAGPAKRLFEDASLPAPAAIPRYEVSADGRRFLLVETIGGEDSRPPAIHVVEHWFAEFRERKEGGK